MFGRIACLLFFLTLLVTRPGVGVVAAQEAGTPCTGTGPYLACIETDRAQYAPGDSVAFHLTLRQAPAGGRVVARYLHLGDVVAEQSVPVAGTVANWRWLPPADDGKGYLVEMQFEDAAGAVQDRLHIAVDVSSTWTYFPRYGFLATFADAAGNPLPQDRIDAVVARLNRFHINGLQFYDWHYKHHRPLKGTADNPAPGWRDVANRPVWFETVKDYIDAAHERGMQAMAYNLLYGAYRDAAADGVDMAAWGLYTDAAGTQQDFHPLPSDWASDIMLMNPADPAWQDYLFDATADVFAALPFDGWHVDQLGDRGVRYDAEGRRIDVAASYTPFLENAQAALGDSVELVLNAVNQYGQPQIGQAPVSFLYTEVWPPNSTFTNLRRILSENEQAGGGRLRSVLAAYMNYELAQRPGTFNTPAVLLADAVIFASGGAHLELGEHMLSREYFPAHNLAVSPELDRQLVAYYDFLVAYQNLLRGDGLTPAALVVRSPEVSVTGYQMAGGVWSFARSQGDRDVAHLINLKDATTLSWRDDHGRQAEPTRIDELPLTFETGRTVRTVWAATPDAGGGAPQDVAFTQDGSTVTLALPSLKYWTMLVVEYAPESTGVGDLPAPGRRVLEDNYPDPFTDVTRIAYAVETAGPVTVAVYDTLGRYVCTLADGGHVPGRYEVAWDGTRAGGARAAGGLYFYRLTTPDGVETGSMMLIR